ncbi:MAG: outer membrane lipoprotein carrier protein LolA [Alphaproteobacteria bacterium]|nr:outer membrane lipoprotein carrier protein LolA [Alphaproteobacteria bacterium]
MLKYFITLGSCIAMVSMANLSLAQQPKALTKVSSEPEDGIKTNSKNDTSVSGKKSVQSIKQPVTPKVVRGIYYSPERQQYDITRVEHYLNGLTTMVADFTQFSPDGSKQGGKFYLSRPGKLRWEYSPVPPVVIVARNGSVTYFDKELNQVSHVTSDDPLANILTRKKIELKGDLQVVYLDKPKDEIIVSIVKQKNPTEGRVTFTMKDPSMQLESIEVADSAGNITKINFSNVVLGGPVKESLFYINQNMESNRSRRR